MREKRRDEKRREEKRREEKRREEKRREEKRREEKRRERDGVGVCVRGASRWKRAAPLICLRIAKP
jgi:hypothetical protein